MSDNWNSAFVKCPFYRCDNSKSIGCMGFTDDSRISIIFEGKARKEQQSHIFCRDRYDSCEVYRMLMECWDC